MKTSITWECKFFDDLKNTDLYAIGHLRQKVFVVEQDCPYIDFDFKDLKCWHVMGWDEAGTLVATTRLVPKQVSYPNDIAIGRVVTDASVRGLGVGRGLMQQSIAFCWDIFGKQNIRISAQDYLLNNHPFGIRHNSYRTNLRIEHNFLHLFKFAKQILQLIIAFV